MEYVDSVNPLLRHDGAYVDSKSKIVFIFCPDHYTFFWRFDSKNFSKLNGFLAEYFFDRGWNWSLDAWGGYDINEDGSIQIDVLRTEEEFHIYNLEFAGTIKKNELELRAQRIHHDYGKHPHTKGITKTAVLKFKFIPVIDKGKTLTGRSIKQKEQDSFDRFFEEHREIAPPPEILDVKSVELTNHGNGFR